LQHPVPAAGGKALRLPGILLDVGLGGFADGIVLHQVLQWHHMLTSEGSYPATTVAGLETFGPPSFFAQPIDNLAFDRERGEEPCWLTVLSMGGVSRGARLPARRVPGHARGRGDATLAGRAGGVAELAASGWELRRYPAQASGV
jgi:Predicted membrane protein (DUF2243)